MCFVDVQDTFIEEDTLDNIRDFSNSIDIDAVGLVFNNKSDSIFVSELGYEELTDSEPNVPAWVRERSSMIFERTTYDGTRQEDFAEYIAEKSPEVCYLVGFETDACILATAMGLFDMGIRPVIVSDCCGSSIETDKEEIIEEIAMRNIGENNVLESNNII